MNIGIIGLGVVGTAVKYGMEKLGHAVIVHDIKLNTDIATVANCDSVYICVPTPSMSNGSCNTSIVDDVVASLASMNFSGIVAIKSTVSPGTTRRLSSIHPELKICFVPEFLRERCAITDFTENHDLCIVGTDDDTVFDIISSQHGKYPAKVVKLSPTDAEMVKYFNNIYNATLITFANSFYEVCNAVGADYSNVKNAIVNRNHITDIYLDCNENFRGFAGVCLPKDLAAIRQICEEKGLNVDFFKNIELENTKYNPTVFSGMRME